MSEDYGTFPWALSDHAPPLADYKTAVARAIEHLSVESKTPIQLVGGIASKDYLDAWRAMWPYEPVPTVHFSEGYPATMMTTKLVLHVPDDRYGAVLEAVGRALVGDAPHGSSVLLAAVLENTERLITMTEDLSTAEANLDAEVTQDVADKQALRDANAALQAANAALQATVVGDTASLATAQSQLSDAAGKVQASVDKLASSDTDLPPASPPADPTPVEPTPDPVPAPDQPDPVPAPIDTPTPSPVDVPVAVDPTPAPVDAPAPIADAGTSPVPGT